MNPIPSASPWLEHTELDGEDALIGDRAGFEALRDHISNLLAGPSEMILLDEPEILLKKLKLCDPPPPPTPTTIGERIFLFSLATFFVVILLLGLGTLFALIAALFSTLFN